ncbi:hypothetical protein G9A89_012386 [Geosiphon pyriformis]|nr:hypothetical protein G9A89_012386 [Geosiphon pyriformis]
MADSWYHKFLRYFCDNNSINCLASIFTTIKQGDTEVVITYLGHFYRNLSILQQVCSMHPVDFPTTMTHVRDFEAAKLEASHVQAVNLVINGSSDLDSKLKQFSDNINQKLEGYLANNYVIYQPPQQFSDSESPIQLRTISKRLPAYDATTNLSANNISTANLSAAATNNLSTTATSHLSAAAFSNLLTPTSSNATPKLSYNDVRKPEIQNHPKLEISNGCLLTDPQFIRPAIGISLAEFRYQFHPKPEFPELFKSPAIVTNDESLAAIFPFELEEVTLVPLFSRAALKEKPITAMYTNTKVDGHSIKLIFDSGSAGSIITRQLIDQLGC